MPAPVDQARATARRGIRTRPCASRMPAITTSAPSGSFHVSGSPRISTPSTTPTTGVTYVTVDAFRPVDRALPRSGFTDIAHFLTGPAAERPAGVWLVAHDAWVSATVSRTHRAGGHPGEVTVCASPWELVCLSGMWWAFLSGGTLHWHDPNAPHAHRRAARHLTRAARGTGFRPHSRGYRSAARPVRWPALGPTVP